MSQSIDTFRYLVQKAPLAQILKRRFSNVLQKLPGAYPGSADKVARDRVSVLMETLEQEADRGSEAFQLVQAAGSGSLRDNLRAISAIFRSSPRTMDRLVVNHAENGRARLTTTQTLRALMREDLSNPDSNKLIPNVFDVDGQLTMPYSLGIRELQQVRAREAHAECTVSALLNSLSIAGIDRTIAERTLIRMRSQRFLSVAHMLPELRDTDAVKITRLGIAVLDIILSEASYFSRAAFNTYIYVKETYQNMRSAWTSDADYRLRFDAIARQFIELIVTDDAYLRKRIDLSLLEPVVSQPLPGLLDGTHTKGGVTEGAE